MAEKTISLRDLRQRIRQLDKLVTDAWFTTDAPAQIDFSAVREHAAAISAMVADDSPPHAATTKRGPKAAADNDKKSDAETRAAYRQAAADNLPEILGIAHVRRS